MGNPMRIAGVELAPLKKYHFGNATMETQMETFGQKLFRLRKAAGLTQEALARAIDMSLSIVRDYERGAKEPSMRSAFKLARALGVDCRAFEMEDAEAPAPAKKKRRGK